MNYKVNISISGIGVIIASIFIIFSIWYSIETTEITVEYPVTTYTKNISGKQVFYNVISFDKLGSTKNVYCDSPSGSFFPIGNTTVICSTKNIVGKQPVNEFIIQVIHVNQTSNILKCGTGTILSNNECVSIINNSNSEQLLQLIQELKEKDILQSNKINHLDKKMIELSSFNRDIQVGLIYATIGGSVLTAIVSGISAYIKHKHEKESKNNVNIAI